MIFFVLVDKEMMQRIREKSILQAQERAKETYKTKVRKFWKKRENEEAVFENKIATEFSQTQEVT